MAASHLDRLGIAARLTRIMPVLYSLLITSTARMATAAWPSSIPVSLTLAVSAPHEAGHFTTAPDAALAPTVTAYESGLVVPQSRGRG